MLDLCNLFPFQIEQMDSFFNPDERSQLMFYYQEAEVLTDAGQY